MKIDWHPELPIYASEVFLAGTGDPYGWLGGFEQTGRLRCVLPFTVLHKPGFRMVRFRTETISVSGDLAEAEERSFLDGVVHHLLSTDAHLVLPATNNALFRTYPAGAVAAPYGTFINDLEQPEDTLWKNISEAYRKDIRRAVRNDVQIKTGIEYLEAAYTVIADTLKRSEITFKSIQEITNLVSSLGDHIRVSVALHQDIVQAALLMPFSTHTAYTLYGGTIPDPARGAMHLLHWESMRAFQGMGVKRFNFTGVRIDPERGSKQEGIRKFKERFGGTLVHGYMWKYPLRPLHFAAYSLAVRWLRGGDIVDQECHKLRPEYTSGAQVS